MWLCQISEEDLATCCRRFEVEHPLDINIPSEFSPATANEAIFYLKEGWKRASKTLDVLAVIDSYNDEAVCIVQSLLDKYHKNKDPNQLYSLYSSESQKASNYFPELNQSHAALVLIKVFDAIVQGTPSIPFANQAIKEVTEREISIIEYIAGYVLRKSKVKFSAVMENISEHLFKQQSRHEFLAHKQQLNPSLVCPSDSILTFFVEAYKCFIKESHKPLPHINFAKVVEDFMVSSCYDVFFTGITENASISQEEGSKFLNYLVSLFVKILAHRYAKHLLHLQQKITTKGTKGLRGELKK